MSENSKHLKSIRSSSCVHSTLYTPKWQLIQGYTIASILFMTFWRINFCFWNFSKLNFLRCATLFSTPRSFKTSTIHTTVCVDKSVNEKAFIVIGILLIHIVWICITNTSKPSRCEYIWQHDVYIFSFHTVNSRFLDGLQRVKELNANAKSVYVVTRARTAFKTNRHFNHN